MSNNIVLSNTTQPTVAWTNSGTYVNEELYGEGNIYTDTKSSAWNETYTIKYLEPINNNNEKGDDDMRYLYEVILVNPKNDDYVIRHVIAKSETSAIMQAYDKDDFSEVDIKFDDLKTSCRVLMEWKKEKSLKKAIETIKKAVE